MSRLFRIGGVVLVMITVLAIIPKLPVRAEDLPAMASGNTGVNVYDPGLSASDYQKAKAAEKDAAVVETLRELDKADERARLGDDDPEGPSGMKTLNAHHSPQEEHSRPSQGP